MVSTQSPAIPTGKFWNNWLSAVIIMYCIWQIIWKLGDIRIVEKDLKYWLTLSLYLSIFTTIFFIIRITNIEEPILPAISRLVLVSILFTTIQYTLRSQNNISNLRIEKEQLQTENYKAQLKVLRAQVDPHFLFNSLNTLRSMVRQNHSNSEQFVMSLSDFYRTTLKHNDNTTLTLSEELNVLESYLFLMKSRTADAVRTTVNIDKRFYKHRIPSLALQVLVENCFKHNSMTVKKPLEIIIEDVNASYIRVCNNIQPKLIQEESTGYGLDLLRKRYELLNVKDGLIVEKTGTTFCIKLKLLP